MSALTRVLFCHGEMEDGKQLLRIGPDAREAEAGRGRGGRKAGLGVLVGKFRDDFFAAQKVEIHAADADGLRCFAEEMHFDSPLARVVNRLMSPEREIEVCAELAVR